MMGQDDLDDLVMDSNIGRDNKKGKGILTILALLIAILIIVIMMAKMVMGDKEANKHLVKTEQESLISPELQLEDEDSAKESDNENLDSVSSMIEDNKTDKSEIKEDTVEINEDKAKVEVPPVAKKDEPKKEIVQPKKVEEPKQKPKPKPVVHTKPKSEPKLEPKPKPKPVEKRESKSHTSKKGSYYIQVGSFANKPSSRFLSVISNSGFTYKLHKSGKLLIGSYSSRESANRDLPRVKDLINKSAFVIKMKQ